MKQLYVAVIGLFVLTGMLACTADKTLESGAGESYIIKADLSGKGVVNGFYDKAMNTLTLDVSWQNLFVANEDAITAVKIMNGQTTVRTFPYSSPNPSNDGVTFSLGTSNKLSEAEEADLLSGLYDISICTEKRPSGITGGMITATFTEPEKHEVVKISSISLRDGDTYRLEVGTKSKLPVLVHPYYADNTTMTYESLDPSFFTIDAQGMVTSLKAGVASVKVTTQDGSNITDEYKVQGTHPDYVSDIVFDTTIEFVVIKGFKETVQLAWQVKPASALNKEVTFTSSNSSIATVDQSGLVSAVGSGNVTITAKAMDGTNVESSVLFYSYGTYQQLDRTGWTATASSFQSGNTPNQAFDGVKGKLWHNQWSPATTLPQWLLLDLGQLTGVTKIEVDRRSDNNINDLNTFDLYIGETNVDEEMTKVGTYVYPTAQVTMIINLGTKQNVRYLKFVCTKSGRGSNVSIDDIRAYLME